MIVVVALLDVWRYGESCVGREVKDSFVDYI